MAPPIYNRTSLPVSAMEWVVSASIAAEPVSAAATPLVPRPAGSPRPRRPRCGRLPPRCGSPHPSTHGPLPGRLPYRPYHHGNLSELSPGGCSTTGPRAAPGSRLEYQRTHGRRSRTNGLARRPEQRRPRQAAVGIAYDAVAATFTQGELLPVQHVLDLNVHLRESICAEAQSTSCAASSRRSSGASTRVTRESLGTP